MLTDKNACEEKSGVPMVWLVVPVYNAAPYLDECLQSIARQTFADLHVVIVDDGSTDGSQDIARQMCEVDSRFELIVNAHGGVSRARNTGIGLARGRYLGFVDADDRLFPWSIECMVTAMMSTGSQVCVGGILRSDRYVEGICCQVNPVVMDYETAMERALYQDIILNSPWGMLLERELLGDLVRFDESIRYEDLDAFYRFYEKADRIAYIPQPLYFYRQAPGSFMHQWSHQRLDALDVTDRIVAYMGERHPSLVRAALDRQFSAHFNILLLMAHHGVDDAAARARCLEVIRRGRRDAFVNPRVRLKNKAGAMLSFLGGRVLWLIGRLM